MDRGIRFEEDKGELGGGLAKGGGKTFLCCKRSVVRWHPAYAAPTGGGEKEEQRTAMSSFERPWKPRS